MPGNLLDEDFQSVVREHKHKVTLLKSRGLLDAFLEFNEALKSQFATFLAPRMPLSHDQAHVVSVEYAPATFSKVKVESNVDDAGKYLDLGQSRHRYDGVIEARPGLIRYWWIPGVYAVNEARLAEGWESYVKKEFCSPYRDLMTALYSIHFGEAE